MSLEQSSYQSLIKLQQVCLKQNIPIASYRLPLQQDITTLVQYQSSPVRIDFTTRASQEQGFVIAPFVETDACSTYILNPDFIFHDDAVDSAAIELLSKHSGYQNVEKRSVKDIITTTREDFIRQVNDAKEAMQAGEFHKVVLSKVRVENLNEDFDASTFFLQLCNTYPHAFVYLVQLPEAGCWIGATPEPLLVVEEGKVKTVSLAGTQIASDAEVDSYVWSSKELEEQGIVTGFVEKTLQSLNINKFSKNGPSNYKAANLIHLRTSFEFESEDLGDRLGDFIKALHPTPSVGGLPKDAARKFILGHESYHRSYYTGFLGPVNIEHKSNIFVNLRCLQLFQKQFVLYSGAGITTSSIAEREWEETDNKMMTMMNVMNRTI
ncbi:MAG: isochorismate synthase [Paludibacter sp.]|nr:isochorismate synthase [Paludibacter sp.]